MHSIAEFNENIKAKVTNDTMKYSNAYYILKVGISVIRNRLHTRQPSCKKGVAFKSQKSFVIKGGRSLLNFVHY